MKIKDMRTRNQMMHISTEIRAPGQAYLNCLQAISYKILIFLTKKIQSIFVVINNTRLKAPSAVLQMSQKEGGKNDRLVSSGLSSM